MRLQGTLARVNAVRRRRHEAGLSTDVVDFQSEVLRDDRLGLFLRLKFTTGDGDQFEVDTIGCTAVLTAIQAQ